MKIAMITTGLQLGGAERQVAELASAFLAMGHQIAVISLTPQQDVSLPEGIEIVRLHLRKHPVSLSNALALVRRWASHWQPDIVHSHMFHANVFARLLNLRSSGNPGAPLVCTAHSLREGGALRMLAYRLTDGRCALTTHVSDAGLRHLIDTGATSASRACVVPNGIDTRRFLPDEADRIATRRHFNISPEARVILNAGRLVPEKAQHRLISAFAGLMQRVTAPDPARLWIAGDGPLREQLQRQIDQLGIARYVRLLGPRADMPALMNAADLFVLSSDLEGLPLVVGEAMACGTPVVATDVPGIRALFRHTSGIVPVGDTEAMSQAMQRTLTLPRLNNETAANRSLILEEFDLGVVARRWIHLYQRLAAGQPVDCAAF